MGKRKSRKPVKKEAQAKKVLQPLEKTFDCPFCNHEKSCDVVMDRIRKVGEVKCHTCDEMFRTPIHNLSEPIDVYNDWVDACEEAN